MKILVVIPVYNEEKLIADSLRQWDLYAHEFLAGYEYKLVVADNNSTDQTGTIVRMLINEIANLEYLHLGQKGKGLAVLTAWQKYQADFDAFAFMDADLAVDLSAFIPLVTAIEQGSDVAIGSRYLPDSQVDRSMLRKIFSWFYGTFAGFCLGLKIKDLPCGFKAVNQKVVINIVPLIKNTTFFFDTELLYLSSQKGYQIKEIPVKWTEKRAADSKVSLVKVSWLYIKEVFKLRFGK